MSEDIYVAIEHLNGKLQEISYVMAAAARSLCSTLGGRSVGFAAGETGFGGRRRSPARATLA